MKKVERVFFFPLSYFFKGKEKEAMNENGK